MNTKFLKKHCGGDTLVVRDEKSCESMNTKFLKKHCGGDTLVVRDEKPH